MITGTVTPGRLPVITVAVGGLDYRAIIDTGFSGDLELPASMASALNPRFIGRGRSVLAGGQTVEEDCYLVDFPFDGRVMQATVTFVTGGEVLIGTRFLRDYRLEIDFVAQELILERLR